MIALKMDSADGRRGSLTCRAVAGWPGDDQENHSAGTTRGT